MADKKKVIDGVRKTKFFDSKLDPDAYNLVARYSGLTTIQLLSSHFDVSPLFFNQNDKVKIQLCHSILSIDVHNITKEAMVAGIFRYEIVAKVSRKQVMNAKADFMALYDLPEGSAENEAKAFCARVGLFAAYPYFRTIFSQHASFASLELPILPVLSADPLKRSSGKQVADINS